VCPGSSITFPTFFVVFGFSLGHTAETDLGLFFSLPAAQALGQIPHDAVLPRLTAPEPQDRAVDQIPQFAVRNSHFL